MSAKLGRNDPCYCGSGKKYKKCHMAADELEATLARRTSMMEDAEEEPFEPSPDTDAEFQHLLREFINSGLGTSSRSVLTQTLAKAVLRYAQERPTIEAASEALDAHWAEYERLLEDGEAHYDRIAALFSEERFAPFRYSAADIQRAFDAYGQPPGRVTEKETEEYFAKVLPFLADKSRRQQIGLSLFTFLPDFVKEERLIDGIIVQQCAHGLMEPEESIDTFLLQMFCHGYEAWARAQKELGDAVFRDLGMDSERLRSMSPREIQAWLDKQEADPAARARLEAALAARPEVGAATLSTMERMRREFYDLLEREDASELWLSPEELEPWLELLEKRFNASEKPAVETTSENALAEQIFPVVQEMTKKAFSQERIEKLVNLLEQYAERLTTDGETAQARLALWASASLKKKEAGTYDIVLEMVAFASLGKALLALKQLEENASSEEPAQGNDPLR